MMLWFTEKVSKKQMAVNPEHVVAVFEAAEGEQKGSTVLGLINGTVLLEESTVDVVGRLNGEFIK